MKRNTIKKSPKAKEEWIEESCEEIKEKTKIKLDQAY